MVVRDEVAARPGTWVRYDGDMDKEEHLRRHLELCKRVYERMKREGSWPWAEEVDSPKSEDVVDSSKD